MLLIIYLVLFYFFPQWQCIDLEEVIVSTRIFILQNLTASPTTTASSTPRPWPIFGLNYLTAGGRKPSDEETDVFLQLPPSLPPPLSQEKFDCP